MEFAFKVVSFVLIAVLVLQLGAVIAEFLYRRTHPRYHHSNTGSFYGQVLGRLDYDGETAMFSFGFEGTTEPQWRWVRPMNFAYTNLDVAWTSSSVSRETREATLSLPSFNLSHDGTNIVLTTERLEQMLLGGSDYGKNPESKEAVDDVYRLLQAAGKGELPPPRHHPYYWNPEMGEHFETWLPQLAFLNSPSSGRIQHFSLGTRYSEYGFAWLFIWFALMLCCRQTSSVLSCDPSAARRMRMICSVVCRVFFMDGFSGFPGKPSHSQWASSRGPNQWDLSHESPLLVIFLRHFG